MGVLLSRWRAKPSTVDLLEGIDKDIHSLEDFREKNQRNLKSWVRRLLVYSCLLFIVACVVVYFWYLPPQLAGQLIVALPFLVYPVLVWLARKLTICYFTKRAKSNDEKLEDLKSQKRKILEEVMETETYKNAKMILERFDPDSKKKVMELESTPIGPQMAPRPGQELRQRNVAPRTAVAGTPVSAVSRPTLAAGVGPSGPLPHSAPGGPPERNLSAASAQQGLMRRHGSPGVPVAGVGLHPPGPPLARPILPRDRSAMDRVLEYLVGDGPQNRYALVCQQCFSHNGMALREEFEYVAFRCAYCFFLNPARKTRPHAPRLPDFSFERKVAPDPPAAELSPVPEHCDPPCVSDTVKSEDCPPESGCESRESVGPEEAPAVNGPSSPASENSAGETSEDQLEVSQMEVE